MEFKFKSVSQEYEEKSPSYVASELFHAQTQFHIWHLQAQGNSSYSFHMALNEFYTSLTDFVDDFIETVQGKTKKIVLDYTTSPVVNLESTEQVIASLDELKECIEEYRTSLPRSWANIDNQLQVVIDQIESTTYKLTFLK